MNGSKDDDHKPKEHKSARRRWLTAEEKALWQQFVKNIQPLKRPIIPSVQDSSVPATTKETSLSKDKLLPVSKTSSTSLSKKKILIVNAEAREIFRGKQAIEACIDLHGLTQEQAQQELWHFIQQCRQQQKRFVLVITGKGSVGLDKGGEWFGGVLRQQVPRWLEAWPEQVIAYAIAKPKHGGDGALYMLLRKVREKK